MYPDEPPTDPFPVTPVGRVRRAGRRPRALPVVAAVIAVLLASVTVLAWPVVFRPAAASTGGEVFLEPAGAPGSDPFTGTVVFGNPPGTKSQTPVGASGGGVPTVRGDTPALYGGSTNEKVCDRAKLITFLQANPDKAAAWAGVLGVRTADIAAYIGTLTPVQLRADTRVTNHGFKDGRATTLQSVLQAGTAVLVDDEGRPRVKCGCGNPLLDPVATPVTPVYTGDRWDGFSERGVSAVSPASAPVVRFVVYDILTGGSFSRPRGTDGAADTPVSGPTAAPTPAPPAPTPVAAPTVGPCPAGTHLQSGSCVRTVPVACPSGQTRVSGRCVPVTLQCPDGSHPAAGGTSCTQDGPPAPPCQDGFHTGDDGTTCVPDAPVCQDGSHLDGGTCVDDTPSPVSCPANTHAAGDGSCAPDTPVACGEGDHLVGGTCVDDTPSPVSCPAKTHAAGDGSCVPDKPVECSDGTHLAGGSCVDDPTCPDGYHVGYNYLCTKDCPTGYHPEARDGCVRDQSPCAAGTVVDPNGNCLTTTGRRRRATAAGRGAGHAGGGRRPADP